MFETEEQLLVTFDSALRKSDLWLRSPGRRTFTMEEVDGLHGRVDRMMVSLPSGIRPSRSRSALIQQPTCCRIIIALHVKEPKRATELARETGRSSETVHYWLRRMESEELVRLTECGGYILGPQSNLPNCEIWCFEGKLKNWKRALYQATRYRAFANRSFVVMPEIFVRTAEAQVSRFRLAKVGLLAVDEEGQLRVITKPRAKPPRSSVLHTMATGRAMSRIA